MKNEMKGKIVDLVYGSFIIWSGLFFTIYTKDVVYSFLGGMFFILGIIHLIGLFQEVSEND